MDANRFDGLARALATGASRRQVLKGLVSLAVGNLLAHVGFRSQANAYVAAGIDQGTGKLLYLPRIMTDACAAASACGERHYCRGQSNCICIRSAEGSIRCGKIPSTCHMPLCTTSDDCAHLGPGYFCDSPNSGCCTDPPASLSRCIPPCGPACPAERVCGEVGCCGEDQFCVDSRCESACPPQRVCGEVCCGDGEICRDGQCADASDCELQAITLEAMRAALDALQSGAASANLSPQGCIQVQQELSNNEVIARSFIIAGQTVSSWTRSGNQWIEKRDEDRDGFFEWQSVTTYGAISGDFQTVETEYDPATQQPVERTTFAPQDDTVHFVIEEADTAGSWQVVEDYQTPRVQAVTLAGDLLPGDAGLSASPAATCEANPCDPDKIKERMEEGVNLALQCLANFGDRGVAIYESSFNTLSRNITIRCAAIPGETEATIEGWENRQGPLTITVDPAKFCGYGEGQRAWLLYHEVLHAALRRGHNPRIDALPLEQRKQLDRVYGCIALCYTNQADPTQCMCAQCLKTRTCDPVCANFKQDCGATCPCPARQGKYYTTCSQCLAECPSGLSCAGYSTCDPVGHTPSCPPVTCP
ncbi:MAG TPA: hypothetical protein VNK95_21820 [Caldilineaceae bacterium]|nr:hypothetical protein [Caldilineaceae bacterium]